MSLFDELNSSFSSVTTIVQEHGLGSCTPTSLSIELEQARNDLAAIDELSSTKSTWSENHADGIFTQSRYRERQSVSRCARRQYIPSDYSGSEWGDPADDSDPDGRLSSLDNAIDRFLDAMTLEFDSAYESQEDDSETEVTSSTMASPPTVIQRFAGRLASLASQDTLELSTTSFASSHHRGRSVGATLRQLPQDLRQFAKQQDVDKEVLDDLASTLSALIIAMPPLDYRPLDELELLEAETNALVADLAYLRDCLQETRQITSHAQRALKKVKESVGQWKMELHAVEGACRWLEDQGWDDRLRHRTASRELEVIRTGFEEYCKTLQLGAIEASN